MMRRKRQESGELERVLRFEATEEELLAWYMRGVLERTGGNQCAAERILAIARTTIRRRLAKMPAPAPPREGAGR